MKITKKELISIIVQFNPWWKREKIPDLSAWHGGIVTDFTKTHEISGLIY